MLLFGSTYNFNTISTKTLPNEFKNMKVSMSGFGFKQAVKYTGIYNDVVTTRQQLVIETGLTLVKPEEATYVLLEDTYGNEVILALDWIVPDSLQVVEGVTLNLTINNITNEDVPLILEMLNIRNYRDIESNVV